MQKSESKRNLRCVGEIEPNVAFLYRSLKAFRWCGGLASLSKEKDRVAMEKSGESSMRYLGRFRNFL